jgi:hypothetical protein
LGIRLVCTENLCRKASLGECGLFKQFNHDGGQNRLGEILVPCPETAHNTELLLLELCRICEGVKTLFFHGFLNLELLCKRRTMACNPV